MDQKLIRDTMMLAVKLHEGQMYGDKPYTIHLADVFRRVTEQFGFETDIGVVALLHDSVEDTEMTLEGLLDLGYTKHQVESVGLVTKLKRLSYDENIQRIIDSRNLTAMKVKWADNTSNLNGDKSDWSVERRTKANEKYAKSADKIWNAIMSIEGDV